jgi:hypothetical protein
MLDNRTKKQIIEHGKKVGLATRAIEAGMKRAREQKYTKDHDIALAILVELEYTFDLRIRRKLIKEHERFQKQFNPGKCHKGGEK